ncbi:MAG: adenosylcobalamin-dependent ribonucleoside-diphosphate reductase [Nitrospirae bacterium]|nr:adenosylcobalamin-dependent ribonucleoside-diphosphate reductase [Nitrospirota bacterium]
MPVRIPQLSRNARVILNHRYLRKNAAGRVIETPARLFRRVARNIAESERSYDPDAPVQAYADRFYALMAGLQFLPNSPTLMNAGRELQQLSACFVLPVADSLESIFDAVKQTALIHQSGGGTGFSFSRLRPKSDRVLTTSGVASGPVSFMRIFNMATEVIKQGGTRRGANMGILRVDHPDIEEFIAVKDQPSELTNFNLSVAVTDDFMRAVERNAAYPLINPRTGRVTARPKARMIFDRIAAAAWRTGDPGLIFLDRINRDNPTPELAPIDATNPCGEMPLLPYESCNLGSINLTTMTRRAGGRVEIDWPRLADTVHLAVRFLDDVIDRNRFPLEPIAAITQANRKIGLGVMGFADLLILMGVPYDSEDGLKLAEQLMRFIHDESIAASQRLAQGRGTFPEWSRSRLADRGEPPRRNATTTSIAPTGTLSILAGCSSGIEPLYAVQYVRTAIDRIQLKETHPLFIRMARAAGCWTSAVQRALGRQESIQSLQAVPAELRRLFVTAHDITPEWHIRMQAAFQRHTDNAVSKTINFPPAATVDDVKRSFLLAYREDCKGITVYRSGSRERQVLACTDPHYC